MRRIPTVGRPASGRPGKGQNCRQTGAPGSATGGRKNFAPCEGGVDKLFAPRKDARWCLGGRSPQNLAVEGHALPARSSWDFAD